MDCASEKDIAWYRGAAGDTLPDKYKGTLFSLTKYISTTELSFSSELPIPCRIRAVEEFLDQLDVIDKTGDVYTVKSIHPTLPFPEKYLQKGTCYILVKVYENN